MIDLEIETKKLSKKVLALQKFKGALQDARRSALSSTGYYTTNKVRDWIESEGAGTWPQVDPLTAKFHRKYKGGQWRARRRPAKAFQFLSKFARYVISRSAKVLIIGFGKFSARDVRKGKFLRFDRKLQKIAGYAQRERQIRLSKKQKIMFALTREKARGRKLRPGKDFFPLPADHKPVRIKARPIMKPVYQAEKGEITAVFQNRFYKALSKRFERL